MATTSADALGGRLPLLDPSTLVGEQRDRHDSMIKDDLPLGGEVGIKLLAVERTTNTE